MLDRYGRDVHNLRISVTDRCNLKCFYCMPGEEQTVFKPREEILSFEEILRLVGVFVRLGFKDFRVTGGEPLVRKGIQSFLERLVLLPGVRKVSLTTNGILLADNVPFLKRIGVEHINISLDSLQPERFREITKGGEFSKVQYAIDACLREGITVVKINAVMARGRNDDEVLDFVELTRNSPLHVRFIEYMTFGDWRDHGQEVVSIGELYERIAQAYTGVRESRGPEGSGPAEYIEIPGHRGTIGFISPVSDKFCANCNRMRLTADGRIKACLLIEEYSDLKKLMREGWSDAELEEALRVLTFTKPEKHQDSRAFSMNAIGG